jgi:ABC-type Na+ efflux pump permease subunit
VQQEEEEMLGRLIGVFALVPATMLLTVSYFVLFAQRKVDGGALKAFGYVVAALLWLGSVLFAGAGMYTLATGRCPMMAAMAQQKKSCDKLLKGPKCGMMSMPGNMMHEGMPIDK